MEELDIRRERKYCSRLGWALVITLVWSVVWQVPVNLADCLPGLLGWGEMHWMPDTLYFLVLTAGHYALSLPVGYALCRRMPRVPRQRQAIGAGRFWRWFAAGAAMLWIGSLLGGWVNNLVCFFVGRAPVHLLDEAFAQYSDAALLLGVCLIGPVCEELLFRGLLADCLSRYGERPAAVVSALLFALFHGNLEQFFYAFALGLLLAYAYFRTGSLRAPVLLHIVFNFYGSGVALLLPDSLLLMSLYGLSWLALTVLGVIALARSRKHLAWRYGPCPPSMQAVFGNVGMTLAIIACFVLTALNFVLTGA